jgi:outer membrane protein OmpA-like peptidoglycan-associated protein
MRIFTLCFLIFCVDQVSAQSIQWARKITVELNEIPREYTVSPTSINNFGRQESSQPGASTLPDRWTRAAADIPTPEKIAALLVHKNNFSDEIIKITLKDTEGTLYRYTARSFSVTAGLAGNSVVVVLHDPPDVPCSSVSIDLYTKDDPRMYPVDAIGIVAVSHFDTRAIFDVAPGTAKKEFIVVNGATRYAPVLYGTKERLDDAINSVYVESKPLISPHGNRLYFVRKNAPGNYNGQKDEQDIYYSDYYNGKWTIPHNIGYPLNDRFANGVCTIGLDGNTMLVLNAYKPSNTRRVESGVSIARKTYNGWTEPIEQIISGFHNLCPYQDYYINNSGDVMILALQMGETFGDQDLYVSYRTGENRWSNPVNIGAVINTEGAEFSPYLSPDNMVLYFASTGHGGYGKSDIFYAVRKGSDWMDWTEPINLGTKVNSSEWDAYFSVSPQMDYGYFISSGGAVNRTVYNPEDADIYRIQLHDDGDKPPVVVVRGRLIDIKSNRPVAGDILIDANAQDMPEIRSIADTRDGFALSLEAGKKYSIRTDATGFIQASIEQDYTNITQYTEIQQDIYVAPMRVGSTFNIDNLNFVVSKAEILPESLPELEQLYELLLREPSLHIELGGHTDNQGSYSANLRLSQQRAQAIKDYLVNRGIRPDRLSAVGYGSSQPIADNNEITARHKNRRVEVKVLNF